MAEFTFTPEFIERTEPTFSPEFAEYAELHHGVVSVNNKQGVVVLYGSDICTSPTDSTTLDQKITSSTTTLDNKINNAVSDLEAQIDLRVVGPNTSTDAHIAVFDGGAGKFIKDSGYTIQTSVPANALFTDAAVKQSPSTTNAAYELLFSATADNTERTEGTKKTSTLTYNPSTKALSTGGTVNGYTLAAASAKAIDTTVTSGSANLPTSSAVVNYITNNIATTAEIDALF